MNRYLIGSAIGHLTVIVAWLFVAGRTEKPEAYFGFQFQGGQSGFGTGKLEPAPAPKITPVGGAPQVEKEKTAPPAVSNRKDQVAVAPPKKIAKKPGSSKKVPPISSTQKKGEPSGRGDSPLGKGDFQGSKTSPVGGVGTSLEIGGFGPGGGNTSDQAFPYAWYGELIYRRLWEAWDRTGADTQDCRIAFTLQRDGTVTAVKIKSPSGDPLFDLSAKRAVETAAPFPPLPDGFKEEKLPVLVRFRLQ